VQKTFVYENTAKAWRPTFPQKTFVYENTAKTWRPTFPNTPSPNALKGLSTRATRSQIKSASHAKIQCKI
jgi:hypothetical protein